MSGFSCGVAASSSSSSSSTCSEMGEIFFLASSSSSSSSSDTSSLVSSFRISPSKLAAISWNRPLPQDFPVTRVRSYCKSSQARNYLRLSVVGGRRVCRDPWRLLVLRLMSRERLERVVFWGALDQLDEGVALLYDHRGVLLFVEFRGGAHFEQRRTAFALVRRAALLAPSRGAALDAPSALLLFAGGGSSRRASLLRGYVCVMRRRGFVGCTVPPFYISCFSLFPYVMISCKDTFYSHLLTTRVSLRVMGLGEPASWRRQVGIFRLRCRSY